MVTQMFRILIYLVIGALFWSNASNEVIEFGFKTGNHSWHGTPHMVTLTLWSESTIYQVSTTAGQSGQTSTWFNFSIHQDPYFHVLGRHCSNITQTKMMIELDNPDAVCIDQVNIVTQSGVWYGIEQFYIRNTLKICFVLITINIHRANKSYTLIQRDQINILMTQLGAMAPMLTLDPIHTNVIPFQGRNSRPCMATLEGIHILH
eukprot:171848_1